MKQHKRRDVKCHICHCFHPPHRNRTKRNNYKDHRRKYTGINMTTERPKRPLSAYMLWLNENREQIKKDNPGSKVTDIAKRGGELWRAMKDKSEWEAKAIAMKEKYTKELKEYEANGGTDPASNKKRKSKAVKPAKKQKKKETSDEESGDEESD